MNPFKNEFEFKFKKTGTTLLLCPDFSNIAALEAHVGSVAALAYECSRFGKDAAALPKMSHIARMVYHCQAHTKAGTTEKAKSLDECWQLVISDGIVILTETLKFLALVTAGDNTQPEMSESQKKS